MTMFSVLKQFNFCLHKISVSDMAMSDDSWFQPLVVRYKEKFALIDVLGDIRLINVSSELI